MGIELLMPGNEVGDRVHNFFAQDNLSQGQNQSQVVEGNWPVLNNNLWVGNQRQIGVQSSNQKNYTPHQSGINADLGLQVSNVMQCFHFITNELIEFVVQCSFILSNYAF